jgi:glycosyltransferase involved in cell wall biosynthesis
MVKARIQDARLWIIGGGTREDFMKKRAEGLEDVTFCGRVSEHEKFSCLRKAHVLLVPSLREGFGINVIEAASAGCPAIGYNVPGLRDSIRDGETGYLVETPDEAAARVIELLNNEVLYQQMSYKCIEYVKDFVWETRVDEFWRILDGTVM